MQKVVRLSKVLVAIKKFEFSLVQFVQLEEGDQIRLVNFLAQRRKNERSMKVSTGNSETSYAMGRSSTRYGRPS